MISIGTDIVKVSRIKALIDQKEEKFLNKIFTEEEISYSFCRETKSRTTIENVQ